MPERMIRPDVQELVRFEPRDDAFFVSFYLNAHCGKRTAPEQRAAAKALIRRRKIELQERTDLSDGQKKHIHRDLDRLRERTEQLLARPHSYKGLVIILSSPIGYERTWQLPYPVRDALIIDRTPYTRPLFGVLDEIRTAGVVLVDRRHVRFFEHDLGRVEEIAAIEDDVPGKVRIAGWYGLEEKRVLRHIEDHVHRHLQHAADSFFRLFRARNWDRIIVGAPRDVLPRFLSLLHPYVRERLAAEITAEPEAVDAQTIQSLTEEILRKADREEEAALVQRIADEVHRNGNAVCGLRNVLRAVNVGAVEILLVEEDYTEAGVVCNECGLLDVAGETCPMCGARLNPVDDVVEECVEAAVHYGARVRHVPRDIAGDRLDRIGALLRFRLDAV